MFVTTNAGKPLDFRFYLDLNRNGSFETNGLMTNVDNAGNIIFDSSGKPVVTFQVGDPEWIGVLEHPDQPYGPNNKFVARYAYLCQPIGNEYDLNYIHNQVFDEPSSPVVGIISVRSMNPVDDGDTYFRNEGVGSWEINLAAFLADLNTNQWDTIGASYNYNATNLLTGNTGTTFDDARALVAYRYNNNYNSLAPVGGPNGLFTASTTVFPPFQNNIDFYSDGPLMTTTAGISESLPISQNISWAWAGSDSTNHFFDLSADLFDPAKSSPPFVNRLLGAGNGTATSDRYTFYSLLDQLGTGSTPESGKMNLNYDNLDPLCHCRWHHESSVRDEFSDVDAGRIFHQRRRPDAARLHDRVAGDGHEQLQQFHQHLWHERDQPVWHLAHSRAGGRPHGLFARRATHLAARGEHV